MSRTRTEGILLSSTSSYTSSSEQNTSEATSALTKPQGEVLGEVQPLSGGGVEGGLVVAAGLPLFLGMDVAFSEANLPDGTDPDESLLTQSVEIPQGYSLHFDGDDRWSPNGDGEMVLQGEYGVFTASADGRSLRYTLTQPVVNESDESDDDYFGYEQVNSLELIDADGRVTSIPLQIEIEDDAPAVNFTDSEGGYETGMKPSETITGLWDIQFGADGKSEEHGGFEVRVYFGNLEDDDYVSDKLAPNSNKGSFSIIKDGLFYGTIVFNTDGTYTFTAGPQEAQLYIGIGTQDSDGDISDIQGAGISLTISNSYVKPEEPGTAEYEFPAVTFDEANLAGGTAPDESALVKTLVLPDGYTVQVDGWESLGDDKFEKEFVGGIKLSYDSNANRLESTLLENVYHGDEKVYDDECYFTIIDAHGREVDATLPVHINDDTPELFFAGADGEDTVELGLGESYAGKWGVSFGADGPAEDDGGFEVRVYIDRGSEEAVIVEQLAPKSGAGSLDVLHNDVFYGTLTFNADGTYTFQASQQEASLRISIGATDSEGDVSQTSGFTLNLSGGNTPVPPVEDVYFDQVVFDEAHLKTGSHPNSAAVSVELPLPEGLMVSINGWNELGNGKYELINDGIRLLYDDYTYKLSCSLVSAYAHDGKASLDLDDLRITLVNGNGNTCNAYLPIKVQDDAPEVLFGGPSGEDKTELGLGEVYTGKWSVAFGADGASEEHGGFEVRVYINEVSENAVVVDQLAPAAGKGSLAVIHNGIFYGTLTFNSDNTYSFEAAQQEGTLYIGIGTRDGDGNEVQTNGFTLNLAAGEAPPPLDDYRFEDVMFFEAHLAAGTDPNAEGVARQLSVPDGFTVATEGWESLGGGLYERVSGGIKLSYDSNANTLVCSLEQAYTHTPGQNELQLDDLSFTLQNADGQTCNAYLPIKVQDDAPEVLFGGPSGEDKTELGLGEVYTGKWNVAFGADGASEEHGGFEVRVYINEVSENAVVVDQLAPAAGKGSLAVIHNGIFYGTLTFNTDNTYSFEAAQQEGTLYIGIGTRDGDGNEVQTDGFTLNLAAGETPPPLDDYRFEDVMFFEAHLAAGTDPNAEGVARQLSVPDGFTVATEGWESLGGGLYERVSGGIKLSYDSNANTLVCSLEQAYAHTPGQNELQLDDLSFTLQNADGQTCNAYLPIKVQDDAPEVLFGGPSGEDKAALGLGEVYTGKWNVAFGADGASEEHGGFEVRVYINEVSENAVVVDQLAPAAGKGSLAVIHNGIFYGTLTFNTDNTYSFEAAQQEGTLYIGIGTRDGDGNEVQTGGFTLNLAAGETPPPLEEYTFDLVVFDEANLANGTAPDASALSKQLSLPSGYKVDTEGWTSVGNGKYELAENGVKLTYDSNGNTLVCSLEQALAHSADGKDKIDFDMPAFSLIDGNGNTCEAYLPVSVQDDIPEIIFTDLDGKNEGAVESGGTFTGTWNVQFGADGPGASGVAYLAIMTENSQEPLIQTITPGAGFFRVTVEIDGVNYGMLNLNADGTYTFQAQPDVQGTLYIALGGSQDGDGDIGYMDDDFGFTLTIGGDEPPVPEDYYFDALTFDEANYALGTNPNPDAFEKKLPMPSGYTVLTDDWEDLGDSQFEISGEGYVLRYDSDLNSLSFILTGPALHGEGSDSIDLELPAFSIVDANGNVRDAYVPVTVIDDTPEASLTGIGGESSATLEVGESYTGRWDIHFGADGPVDSNGGFLVQVHLEGTAEPFSQYVVPTLGASSVSVMIGGVYYGQLSFNDDGTYVFEARGDEKSAGTLSIGISCQDGDGDVVISDGMTLTLTPSGNEGQNIVFETVSFDEANLANGTSPDAPALVQQVELPAGSQIKTDGWIDLGDGKFALESNGIKLTYDSTANTLACSLESAYAHTPGSSNAEFTLPAFSIVDAEGVLHNAYIPVSLKDDAPEADFEGPEGKTEFTVTTGDSFTGNWDIVFGADGPEDEKGDFRVLVQIKGSDEVVSIPVDTALETSAVELYIGNVYYGTISFHADGTYAFDSTDAAEGTLHLSIAGQDSDGDVNGSDRITLTIKDGNTVEPGEPIVLGKVDFDEANLANGTNPDEAALTQVIFLPPGYGLVTEGWTDLGGGKFELGANATDGYFRFFYDGETLTCTLLQPNWHGEHEVANAWLSTLKVVDPDGNECETLLPVTLKDDQPVLEITPPAIAPGGSANVFGGTWEVNFGADGPTVFPGLRVTVEIPDHDVSQTFEFLPGHGPIAVFANNVLYGLIRFDADGSYSLTTTDQCTGKVNMTVSVWDDDTSVVSEEVSVTAGGGSNEIDFPTIVLDEANLPDGTNPDPSALTTVMEVPEGWTVNTNDWVSLGDGVFTLESNGVQLIYDGSSLSCSLVGPLQHTEQGRDSIDFTMPAIQIMSPDGNMYEGRIPVKVMDDMPVASFAGPEGEALGQVKAGGTYTGQWDMKFGADGATEEHGGFEVRVYIGEISEVALVSDRLAVPAKPNLAVIHEGKYYGMLTFTNDGAYTFESAPDTNVTLYIGIGSMDMDGDIAESSGFTLNVGSGSAPTYLGAGVTFDEANLPAGTSHDASLLSKAIALPQGYIVDVAQDGWAQNADGTYSRAGAQGTLIASANGASLSYVLEKAAGQDGDNGYDVIGGITLVDADGKEVVLDAKIEIADDKPSVIMEPAIEALNPIAPGGASMGLLHAEFGADGPNAESAYQLQATVNGQSVVFDIVIGKDNAVDVEINGINYGQIYLEYLEPYGLAYAYQSNPGMPAVASINFAIGLTDGDGDTVFANNGEGVDIYFDVEDPLPNLHLEFNEANMPGGTDENAAALTQTFTLPERYTLYTEGWSEEGGKLVSETSHGLIVYDPVANSVSYTLYRIYNHPEDGKDSLDFTDHLTLLDTNTGNTHVWSFPVTVVDDIPEVSFAPEGGADVLAHGGTLAGAWDVQYGADGSSSLQLRVDSPGIDDTFVYQMTLGGSNNAIVVTLGGYTIGTLDLNDTGTFSFKAAPGVSGQYIFRLEATDGDMDTVSESFAVNILAEGVDIPYIGYGTTFNEAHLPDGTAPDPAALMQYFALPAGYRVDVTDGWYDLGNGMLVKQGAKGYLACSADGTQIGYRLDLAVSNNGMDYTEHDGNMGFDVIQNIKLIGQNNKVIYMDAKAAIMDDAPVVEFGGDNSEAIARGEDFVGVWSGLFGADGPASENAMVLNVTIDDVRVDFPISVGVATEIVIGGVNYGRLLLSDDGTYVYQSSPDMPLTESIGFSLALTDGDGDIAYPNNGEGFFIQITETAPAPSIVLDAFDESNLPNGTDPNAAALTKSFELPAGYEIVLSDWTLSDNHYVMETKDGYLSYDPASKMISFTLTGPITHSAQGNDELALDIGRIPVQDSNGELTSIKVSTTVIDDAPVLEFAQGGNATLDSYQGFATSGALNLEFGADGVSAGLTFPLTLGYSYTNGGQPVDGSTTLDVPLNGARAYFDTAMGRGMVYYDAEQGKVFYEYEALRGSLADSESLTLSVTDADGDVVSADMTMTLQNKVPFVISLDEAGLPNGSGGVENSSAMNSVDMDSALVDANATSIVWNTTTIGISSADGNLDGNYGNVTWKQSGNNLCGYADGELVLEVVPEFYKGTFTGGMSAILHKPFDHSGSNGTLSLNLGFSQVAENGSQTPGNVTVAIQDDVPFANAGSNTVITLDDAGHKTDAVYLVVDTTLSSGHMYEQIGAIRALVQEYKATSPNVEFTLIPFGGGTRGADVRLDSVSAEELLAKLTPDASGRTFLKGNLSSGTDYTVALETTMEAIQSDLNRPGSQSSTVYFMTDGVQTLQKDAYINSWGAFRDSTPDMEVYALGVGPGFAKSTSSGMYPLIHLTGDASHVTGIPNFNNVQNALTGLYQPTFENSLLDGHGSADPVTISSIVLGDVTYTLKDTGDASGLKNTGHISLENGATLVVYENGDYNIFGYDKLTHDYESSIKLTLKDADGSLQVTDVMSFVVKDTVPVAHDKYSSYNPGYEQVSLFGSFESPSVSKAEGWSSYNASWSKHLPAAMEGFPSEELLSPYMDARSICLTAGSMSHARVGDFIGKSVSFSDVLGDLGITSSRYISDSGASRAAMTSKSFSSKGGEVVFNWSFSGSGYNGESDAAFWVLLDANGKVVDSGTLAHFENSSHKVDYESGVARIQVPDSAATQNYKLVIGSVEGGSVNGSKATLYVNAAVVTDDKYHFSGNILDDPASDGSTDVVYGDISIEGVVYNGQTYTFNSLGVLSIEMGAGTFVMDTSGAYSLKLHEGTDFTLVDETLTYILVDGHNHRDSALLTLKGEPAFAYDNIATLEHGTANVAGVGKFAYDFKGNVIEDASVDGQVDVSFDNTHLASISYDGQTRYFSESEQVQVFTNANGKLVIDWNGDYYFTSASGDTSGVSEQFSYTLTQGAAGNSGTVTIRAHGPQVSDLVASHIDTETKVELVNGGEGWTNLTGSMTPRFSYHVSGLPEFPDIIADHMDSVYVRNYGAGAINPVLSQIMGNTKGSFADLLDMAGVEGSAYRPENPMGSFMSTTVKSSGGAIVFDWLMGVDQYADSREMDAAIWVLRDDSNNIISTGTLAQLKTGEHRGSVKASTGNVAVIPLPPTMEEKEYTLVVGTVQVGKDVGHVANFLVDAVVNVEQGFQFKGNVFDDTSLTGQKASAASGSILGMVEYKGTEYMMDESGLITIKTESGGTMYFMYDGTYAYVDADGRDGSHVFEDFNYTVVDGENLYDTATLSLRGDQFRFTGTDYDDVIDHSQYSTPDVVNAGSGDDVVYGGRGNESIYGGDGNDTIYANTGNDRVYGGNGDDELHGGAGNDTLYGGSGNDLIFGDDGNDFIYGGSGDNTLWGGNGADTFAWKHQTDLVGKDVIMDFSVAEGDKLKFDQLLDLDEEPQSFFRSHFSNLNLDTKTDEFSFTYKDGMYAKDIELHFDASSDADYLAVKEAFVSTSDLMLQQEILAGFLSTLAS